MRVGRSGSVPRRATGRRTAGPVGRTEPPSGRALRVGPGRPGPREAGAGARSGGGRQIDQIEVGCRDFGLLLSMIGISSPLVEKGAGLYRDYGEFTS